MYEIVLHNRAVKFYNQLDDENSARINRAIEALLENPASGNNIKMLRGELNGKFRLRAGKYRIVYRIENDQNIVIIEDIGVRGRIY
ncbi:MAG TPA: type II toxin-antitoxin system RelE/ParE family toxin [Anaerovoracaceae bacterium]|nr:type II toxin-antitoxin system RelE/ParE family toxin [Anaerovoracaceae bacterium]